MLLENAQMFSTACHTLNTDVDSIYRPFNPKHPCNIWLVQSPLNLDWLYIHNLTLGEIWLKKTDKLHATLRVSSIAYNRARRLIVGKSLTPFANCTEDKISNADIHAKYRAFMLTKWLERDGKPPTWIGRAKPKWFNQ